MSVLATMTVSLDGYITGPDDGPGCGLGVGGERLHYWVMGGPWTYETDHEIGSMDASDKQFFDSLVETMGAGGVWARHVRGRWTLGRHEPVRRNPVRAHPSHGGRT